MSDPIKTHPVQCDKTNRKTTVVSTKVSMRAYEVYCYLHGEQEALIAGNCRGGFGVGELVAFLYACSFPKEEWRARADEAFQGMVLP
ncbi:MAG: hypothetical protein V3W28_06050 [Thermoplasmata archaeon]